jgi:hypothetical protein
MNIDINIYMGGFIAQQEQEEQEAKIKEEEKEKIKKEKIKKLIKELDSYIKEIDEYLMEQLELVKDYSEMIKKLDNECNIINKILGINLTNKVLKKGRKILENNIIDDLYKKWDNILKKTKDLDVEKFQIKIKISGVKVDLLYFKNKKKKFEKEL